MRISDWSSDVCSSDLAAKTIDRLIEAGPVRLADAARKSDLSLGRFRHLFTAEIGMPFQRYVLWRRLLIAFDAIGGQHSATEAESGRAACRERGVSVRVDFGGRRINKTKKKQKI